MSAAPPDMKQPSKKRGREANVRHPTTAERVARGKAARAGVPREAHATWGRAAGRRDPVGSLEEQATGRDSELVPIRYGRMLVSPFTFYRGAASVICWGSGGIATDRTVNASVISRLVVIPCSAK
jgi:Uncharacterized protein conserved in bacteria (DUF2252)